MRLLIPMASYIALSFLLGYLRIQVTYSPTHTLRAAASHHANQDLPVNPSHVASLAAALKGR